MSSRRVPRRSVARIFLAPAIVALAQGAALTAALLGDGAWDWLASVGLLLPLGWLASAIAPIRSPRWPLPASSCLAKSAPHPRGPAPPNAERA